MVTRTIAIESDLAIAPFKGINSDTSIINVNNTTICAIILFSFFSPELNINRIIPKNNGINEVGEPVVKNKYG